MQLRKEAWKKFMTSTGFGSRSIVGSYVPVNEMSVKVLIFFLRLLYAIALIAFTATIISAVHIWFISYIINNLSWQRRPFTCWTMEENYGLLFCFWKVLLVIFSLFLSYWKDHGLLRSWNFATMATWRNDFSSLLTTPHTNVIFSWKYCSLPFEWWL